MFIKKKIFTLIETLVSMMILSIVILTIYKFYTDFIREDKKILNEEKFNKVTYEIQKSFENQSLNYILNGNINKIEFNEDNQIVSYEPIFESKKIQAIYIEEKKEDIELLFNLQKKDLELYSNEYFDFVFFNQRERYLGIEFPYKEFFFFLWGELINYRDFNLSVKECFFDFSKGFKINSYDNLNTLTNTNNEDCSTVWNNFVDKNKPLLDLGYKNAFTKAKNEFKVSQISNFDFVSNKVKESYNNFKSIANNLKDFAKREIEYTTNSKELMIDHFVLCYLYVSGGSQSKCNIHRGNVSDSQVNVNKIKFILSNDSTYFGKEVDDIENAIFTTDRNSTNLSSIKGTTGENQTTYPLFDNSDFGLTLYGLIPTIPLSIETNIDSNLIFNKDAYRIFGTNHGLEINNPTLDLNKTNGYETLGNTPIYFSNVSLSGFKKDNINLVGLNATILKHFPINVPIVTDEKFFSTGPYSSLLLMIFPWIVEANDDDISLGFGYFTQTIESSN